jgi:hypothetical protein
MRVIKGIVLMTALSVVPWAAANGVASSLSSETLFGTLLPQDGDRGEVREERTTTRTTCNCERTCHCPKGDFRGVSGFFNVREAYANTSKGEFQFELSHFYNSRHGGTGDTFELTQSLRYGVTDDMFVELVVSEPLGVSARGAGELTLIVFNTFLREQDLMPAFAASAAMRIPTGYRSSGVDGTFTGIFTKCLTDTVRMHFQGFVQTANGERGDFVGDRRNFQWGVGPGVDWQFAECTLATFNYLHRSSETRGSSNQNVLELGVVHKLPPLGNINHDVKVAGDLSLDHASDAPTFGARVQWSLSFK